MAETNGDTIEITLEKDKTGVICVILSFLTTNWPEEKQKEVYSEWLECIGKWIKEDSADRGPEYVGSAQFGTNQPPKGYAVLMHFFKTTKPAILYRNSNIFLDMMKKLDSPSYSVRIEMNQNLVYQHGTDPDGLKPPISRDL